MTNNSIQFSSGLESASFLLTSDPIHQAWGAIEKQKQKQLDPNTEQALFDEIQTENPIIVAFATPPGSDQGPKGLVSSLTLKEEGFKDFEFLCNKINPSFSFNRAAIELFRSRYTSLLDLKNKLVKNSKTENPQLIIITGQSLGGSVAALFTLWLLKDLNLSSSKRPLCVTFGSPLVGDEQLRQCVIQLSTWKSCFLHIVSDQDPMPEVFLSRNASGIADCKPFGTFLICSAYGCACFDDPDIILKQLGKTSSHIKDSNYGQILGDLKRKTLCNVFKSTQENEDSLRASFLTQLQAIGILSQTEIESLTSKMKIHVTRLLIQKKKNSSADKRLNEMKVYMAFLEWYKKDSKGRNMPYYDRYRNQGNISDINVSEYKKKLMNYWEDTVAEVESRPQLEGAHFKPRFLYGGTTYRRMVEPLHISDYYKDGGKNYAVVRPRTFSLLEKWLQEKQEQDEKKKKKKEEEEEEKKKKEEEEEEKKRKEGGEKYEKPEEKTKPKTSADKAKREKVNANLTEDSCFWARVEEALLLLDNKDLTSEDVKAEGKKFEEYVWNALKNYEVSPEIFSEKSSFMKWWEAYRGEAESSLFTEFMSNRRWAEYIAGTFT